MFYTVDTDAFGNSFLVIAVIYCKQQLLFFNDQKPLVFAPRGFGNSFLGIF